MNFGPETERIRHLCRRAASERVERRYSPLVGLSPSQILEAKRLYESGESLRQIGFTIGFHDKTVKKALVDAGVDVQDRRRKHSQPRLLRSAPGCGGVGSVKMHESGCGCASAR